MANPPPAPAESCPRWAWIAPACIAALCYAVTLGHGYPWDDEYIVRDNQWLRDPASVTHLADAEYFRSNEISWRPAATFTHWLEMQLVGAPPVPPGNWQQAPKVPWAVGVGIPGAGLFHATNVLLHACMALLVALVATRVVTWRSAGTAPSAVRAAAGLVAGGCMALHPVCVEAVAAISFREDLLAGVGMLGALWCLGPGAREHWGWRAGGWALAALAILSKESALLLPLWLALAEWAGTTPGARRDRRTLALAYGPVLGVAGLYAILRFGPMRGPLEATYAAFGAQWPYRAGLIPEIWLAHLRLLLFPLHLQADYFAPAPTSAADPGVWIGCAALAAFAWGIVAAWRRGWWGVVLGAVLVLLTWGPVSNLLPLPNALAERYLYVSVAGLALVLADVGAHAWGADPARRPLLQGAAVLLALGCGARTLWRVPAWASSATLWAAEPDGTLRQLAAKGDRAQAAGDTERLIAIQQEALDRYGDLPYGAAPTRYHWIRGMGYAHRLHGLRLRDQARDTERPAAERAALEQQVAAAFAEAERWGREAIARNPLMSVGYEDLGHLALERGHPEEALDWYAQAEARAGPGAWLVQLQAGETLMQLDRPAEAEAKWRAALAVRPASADLCNKVVRAMLAQSPLPPEQLVATPRGEEVRELWRRAAAANPWDAQSRFNLGVAALMQRRPADAARWLEQAFVLDSRSVPTAGALADAAEQVGNRELAVQALQRWAQLDPQNPVPRQRLAQLGR